MLYYACEMCACQEEDNLPLSKASYWEAKLLTVLLCRSHHDFYAELKRANLSTECPQNQHHLDKHPLLPLAWLVCIFIHLDRDELNLPISHPSWEGDDKSGYWFEIGLHDETSFRLRGSAPAATEAMEGAFQAAVAHEATRARKRRERELAAAARVGSSANEPEADDDDAADDDDDVEEEPNLTFAPEPIGDASSIQDLADDFDGEMNAAQPAKRHKTNAGGAATARPHE